MTPDPLDVLVRSRTMLNLDLCEPQAVQEVWGLVAQADVLVEGFRPGVMERFGLGLGPDLCLARQPRLVYGRMTGWGQHGPLANAARARHQLHRHQWRAARHWP